MSGTSGTFAAATQTHSNPTAPARYPTTIYLILTGVRTEWHESDAGQTLTIPEFTLRLDHDTRGTAAGADGHRGPGAASAMAFGSGSGSGVGCGSGSGSALDPDSTCLVSGPSVLEVAQMMGRQLLMAARDMKWADTELFELSEAAADAEMGSTGNVDGGESSTGNATASVSGTATGGNGVGVGLGVGAWGSGRSGLMCGRRTLTDLASALRGQRFQALFDHSWEMTRRIMAVQGHRELSGKGIEVALFTWKEYEEECWSRRRGAGRA
ncbi:hypothetical protein JCM24511_00066 [Saitozyma sp. JCM 24511]|nr:hypothetical protein JCM24511_00066 [Saitozyma sp. JCM 24511]